MPRPARASGRRRWLLPAALTAAALAWMAATAAPPPREGRQLFGTWSTRDVVVALALLWAAALVFLAARSRRAIFVALFTSLLGVVTLTLLEVAGRTGFADWAKLFGLRHVAPLGSVRLPYAAITGEAEQDIAARWRLPLPKIPFEYRTDRFGFRNAHDRGEAELYCLGDSFLVAGLLPVEATVTSLLERDLGLRAMNVALIGIGVQEERALWHELGLPVRDRVVLQFVTEDNDLVDSARFRQGRQSWEIASPTARSFLASAIVWLQRSTQPIPGEARTHTGRIGEREVAFQWGTAAFAGLQREVGEVLAAIAQLHGEIAAGGGRHGVVLIPSKLRVLGPRCTWPPETALRDVVANPGPLRAALVQWCGERGIPLLDLTDVLQTAAAGELPYFAFDTHWNAVGHAVVARAIAEWRFVHGR